MLDGTPDSSQEHPHKSRRKLMPQPESEIARDSPNHFEITPNSPALAPEESPIPHHTGQVA